MRKTRVVRDYCSEQCAAAILLYREVNLNLTALAAKLMAKYYINFDFRPIAMEFSTGHLALCNRIYLSGCGQFKQVETRSNQLGLVPVPASFTPTSKVSWKVEAFSLCMFLLLLTLREVPHGTKGTGPRFVTRLMYSRSQLQEQHEHSFCSKTTNAFISYSLYTVRRYCTSPGAPDLRARLG